MCHPERAILLRVERGARHGVSGSRIKSCYPLVDPVLRTPLRGSTSLRSAQDDARGEYGSSWAPTPTNCTNTALSTVERTMCAKTFRQKVFCGAFFQKSDLKTPNTNQLSQNENFLCALSVFDARFIIG